MIVQAFLVILAVCGVLAGTAKQSNGYMDQVLDNLRAIAPSNIDPAQTRDITFKTEHSITPFAPKARFYYFDGNMTGLLKTQRAGDCSAPIQEYENSTITCTLSVDDVKFEYKTELKYGNHSFINGTVTATMSLTFAQIEITSNLYHNIPFMRKLHITQTGTINPPSFPKDGSADHYPTNDEQKDFATSMTAEFYSVFNFNFLSSLRTAVSTVSLPLPKELNPL